MKLTVKQYEAENIPDVLAFERALREEENFWGWEIDGDYIERVKKSFADDRFRDSLSFLAYDGDRVVGRIDAALICSHFDGSVKAYLDWVCVLKSARHQGAAQMLLDELRKQLREQYHVELLIGLIAGNPEAQRFYRSCEKALIRDEGIWLDC